MKHKIKGFIALFFLPFLCLALKADPPKEGMWLPQLLGLMNESDMKTMGLRLTAEDIYSVNQASLKDAVISFGGFCTGELISDQGLVLTNHHCGFGAIQEHSSPENDLLTNGFWAMDRHQELQNPGLTATFIIRIEDVTSQVLAEVTPGLDEAQRAAAVATAVARIQAEAVKGTHYNAQIKPFFYGNEYYMFITETFRDVRLVGAPPNSIGNFGGDTDNWMWPRHNADFSLFRIYSGPDGKPADPSPFNIPFKPRKHFTISLKGVKEGDFTMVYGFPGRTQEYLSSFAVKQVMEVSNPVKIMLRDKAISIMKESMRTSDMIRIQYSAKEKGLSNAFKKWQGEVRGLKRLDAINRKQQQEQKFQLWADADPARKAEYGTVLSSLQQTYAQMDQLQLAIDYFNEAGIRVEILLQGYQLLTLEKLLNEGASAEDISKEIAKIKAGSEAFYKNYHAPVDQRLFTELMPLYRKGLDKKLTPFLDPVDGKYKGSFALWGEDIFANSFLVSKEKLDAFLAQANSKKGKKMLANDPAFKLAKAMGENYLNQIRPQLITLQTQVEALNRTYLKGVRQMLPDKKFYPDANSTLRVTYGKVDDYQPRDGVSYNWFTTLDGVVQKYVKGDEEFDLPAKLLELHAAQDYGDYAEDGVLHTCFTASNHTTGGNSGSPVLNADGHLLGVNFDRNWEGTMSDIMYDPDQCRNITADIRYVLFIVDKFAGAGYLVKEMTIVK
jgi:hypothetical protein